MVVSLNLRGRLFLIISILSTLISVPIRVPPLLLLSTLMISYLAAYPYTMRGKIQPEVILKAHIRHTVLFRGEPEILHIRVENRSHNVIPLVQVSINVPESFYLIQAPKVYKFTLEAQQVLEFNVPILATERGYHHLGPIYASVVDPLQIFEYRLGTVDDIYVRVYPKRLDNQIARTRARLILKKLIGFFAISMKGTGTDFHGLRDYIRGDPSKIVDWKASARRNKLISKEFEDEQQLEIIVALDSGATMRGTKYEYLLGMGMELVKGFVEEGKPTGLVVFNTIHDDFDGILYEFLPSTSPSRMNKIWTSIYGSSPIDRYTDYHTLDHWIEKNGITNSLIIVLGDTEGKFEDISDAIRNIKLRGNDVLFIDIWGYSFTLERLVEESKLDLKHTKYGELLDQVIGRGLSQSNIFRGLEVKQKMARYGTIYGYITDNNDNIVEALDRAMYSFYGISWKGGL